MIAAVYARKSTEENVSDAKGGRPTMKKSGRITLKWVGLNKRNVSGISVKGYVTRRRGRTLWIQSGHLDVISRRWYWRHGDHARTVACSSPRAAREEERRILARKLRPSSGYERLPARIRIKHPSPRVVERLAGRIARRAR